MSEPDPQPRVDAEHPWPALLSFREDDRQYFGGREEEVEALYRRIGTSRLTLLFGLSGLGKTSLLRAGLFPRLRREHYFPLYIRLRYSADLPSPVEQIRDAIVAQARASGIEAPEPRADETLWQYFHRPDADFWDERNYPCTPVLVFDQFEELFTKGREVPERAHELLEELADLAEGAPPVALRLLIGIRSDYLAQLQGISDRVRAVFANRYELRRMSGAAALKSTLTAGGHLMEQEVARRVVRFVAGARDDSLSVDGLEVEPALLSLVCSELNATRIATGEPKITASMLSGSKDEILSRFYESSFADVAPELRVLVEDKLVTRDGRSRNFISEQTARETPGVTDEDLAKLVHHRLLRFEESGSSRRIELTHDLLTTVAAASRAGREHRRQLEEAERARAEAEQREAAARRSLRRSRAAMIVFFLLLAAAVAGPFIAARWTATGAKRVEADSAYRIALQKLSSDVPVEGLAYLAHVVRLDPANSVARTLLYERLTTQSWPVLVRTFGPAERIDGAVFSGDGERVAFVVAGKFVEVWEIASGKRIGRVDVSSDISAVEFASDNQTVLLMRDVYLLRRNAPIFWRPRSGVLMTADQVRRLPGMPQCDDYLQIFDVSANGEELLLGCRNLFVVSLRGEHPPENLLPLHLGMQDCRFAPDARFVLAEATLIIDRQSSGPAREKRTGDTERVAGFSRDGRQAVITSSTGYVEARDLETWARSGTMLENEARPRTATFDRIGRRIVTTADDDVVRVLTAEHGEIRTEVEHPNVKVARLSADGMRLFTGSNHEARWWSTRDNTLLGAPIVQPEMRAAQLHPSGHIVTVSTTARVWRLGTVVRPAFLPHARSFVSISDDGATLLAWEEAGKLSAFDTASEQRRWTYAGPFQPKDATNDLLRILMADRDGMTLVDVRTSKRLWSVPDVEVMGFSDDGEVLVTVAGNTLVVRSAATGKPLGPRIPRGSFSVMSPDGLLFAVLSEGKIQVRNVRRVVLTIADENPEGMVFSRDTRRLVTWSEAGVRVWDLKSGQRRTMEQTDRVHDATFSPDGKTLALITERGVVLCNAETPGCAKEVLAQANVQYILFSSDSRRLLARAVDGVRVWDVATARPLTLTLGNRLGFIALSADGNSLLVAKPNGGLERMPLPEIADADAERLADLAEAVAAMRVDRLGVTVSVDRADPGLWESCAGDRGPVCSIARQLLPEPPLAQKPERRGDGVR